MTPEQMTALAARVDLPDVAAVTNDGDVAAFLNTYADPTLPPVWGKARITDARSVFRRSFKPGSDFTSPGGPTTALVALEDAAKDPQHPVRNVARAALELFEDADGEIDAGDADERTLVLSLLAALVQGGVLPQAGYERIAGTQTAPGLLRRFPTWPEAHLGGVPLTARDVGIARGGEAGDA